MKPDPAIEQVRAARAAISRGLNHDPARVIEYYMALQRKHPERLYTSGRRRVVVSGDGGRAPAKPET